MAVDRDRLRRWRALRRHAGAPRPATTICRYRPASGGYSHRLQGRPVDPVPDGFRKDGRAVRSPRRHLRRGHAAVQHNDVDGTAHHQYPAVLRPVRARGHWRARPRQDRSLQEEGDVDGRGHTPLGYAIKDRKLVILPERGTAGGYGILGFLRLDCAYDPPHS